MMANNGIKEAIHPNIGGEQPKSFEYENAQSIFSVNNIKDAQLLDDNFDRFLGSICYEIDMYEGKKQPPKERIVEQCAKEHFFSRRISLSNIFNRYSSDKKIFSILLDIKISYILVLADMYQIIAVNNKRICRKGINKEIPIFEFSNFESAFEIQRLLNSFVMRYRALCDKLMCVTVYLDLGYEDYKTFCKSKSRKKAFLKRDVNTQIKSFINNLSSFDESFRTPEVHNVGRLYKFTLTNMKIVDTPLGDLIGWHNKLIQVIELFGKTYMSV
jgi:hypothetical protein